MTLVLPLNFCRGRRVCRHMFGLLGILLLAAGCAGHADIQRAGEFHGPYSRGDYAAAATALGGEGGLDYDEENLLTSLQVGVALRAAGSFDSSQVAFDRAESQLLWKSDEIADVGELLEAGFTIVGNELMTQYQGNIYDGVLINTYKAMNALDLGDEARARVELNRADQRQTNAVHQLEAKVRALSEKDPNEDEERAEQSEQINQTLAELMEPDGELGKRLATVAALGEYRHLRNPFTDWLHGAFRLATGEANRASDLFRNAVALDGRRNGHIQEDFRVAEEAARTSAAGAPRRVWIVHEDGMGPRLDELRLDLPVPTPSGLLYAGIALPEFVAGTPAVGGLEVEAGDVLYRTEPLLNVDRYAATEFRAGYDAIVGKAVASAVVKVIAQAVVHEAADEMEGLLGEILKIGTAVAAAAMTQADTRIWWALPQSINVASLPRPADDRIRIMAGSGSLLADIPLPTAAFVLVTVKTTSASAPPVVHVAAFGGNQMTSGDLGAPLAQDLATVHEEPSPPVARFEAAGADAAPIVLAAADDSAIPWWAPYVTVDRVLKRKGLRRLTFTRARNVGGFTRVVGEFINHSDRKFTALFRFTWLDAAGQPIDSILGDWRAVHALPGTRVHIAGTAPRSDVGDFRVELIAASRRGGSNEPSGGQSHKR